jgi:hypothetical protein
VVNFIKRNFDSLYEKQIKPAYPIPRIKHFLIVNITMGKIDPETGDYEFGANEGKLLGYLSVLKRHLGKDYFYRIMAHFNERDLELFHSKEVVTSIGSIMRNRNVRKAREIYEGKMKKGKK